MLVVGLGNRTRGDDGVGPLVAEQVAALDLPGVDVVVQTEPLALVEAMAGHDVVVVVDAVAAGGEPGRVHVRPAASLPPGRATPALGSHGLGVRDAIDLARALGSPGAVTVVGIEGAAFEVGTPVSQAVRRSVVEAARAVVSALAGMRRDHPPSISPP